MTSGIMGDRLQWEEEAEESDGDYMVGCAGCPPCYFCPRVDATTTNSNSFHPFVAATFALLPPLLLLLLVGTCLTLTRHARARLSAIFLSPD